MKTALTLTSIAALALASGLALHPAPAKADSETIGTLGGAAAGGLIGSQFGRGSGNVAATVGGVLAGGVIGNAIGRDADESRAYESGYYPNNTYYAAPPPAPVYYAPPQPVYVAPPPRVVYYNDYPGPWHRGYRHYYYPY